MSIGRVSIAGYASEAARDAAGGWDEGDLVYVTGVGYTYYDGAAWQGTGGGGSRNVGQAEYDYNGDGDVVSPSTALALTYSDGDEGLVDLTAPAAPLIVNAGVYAFTMTGIANADTDAAQLRLLIDDNYYSINAFSGLYISDVVPAELWRSSLAVTWYCDAGDPFMAYVRAAAGGVAVDVSVRVLIQKVSN